jgi:hypothetical protein
MESGGAVAELRKIVEVQGRTIQEHGKKIADQEQRLQAVEAVLSPVEVSSIGEFERWANSEAADEYVGLHVAYLGGGKVIATAKSITELSEKVGPKSGAIFGYIPGE